MVSLLARILIKDWEDVASQRVRQAYGFLCGAVGIGLNILLFLGKLAAGLLTSSIAITADAFNNLSDAGSAIVSVIGIKLAGQKPDSEHPFGHGRIEYLAGLIIAAMILLMGVELGKSSLQKIFHPEEIEFSLLSVGILAASIGVKFYMFFYNRAIGRKIDSAPMKATAADSLNDCISTAAVMLSTLFCRFTGINIDPWCGLAVAVFILISGVKVAKETIDPLLGQAPDPELIRQIEKMVMSYDGIEGIHDLVVHDYGAGRKMISLHAEVPETGDIRQLHDVIDNAERQLREELSCEATIHMDPIATEDAFTFQVREALTSRVHELSENANVHDVRVVKGPTHTNIIFDALIPYEVKMSDNEVKRFLSETVSGFGENCFAVIQVDKSYVL